jgi:hypothetical protein
MTKYVVLHKHLADGDWTETEHVDASSSDAAIRLVVESAGTEAKIGTYVAVPARSWKGRSVTVETTKRVKLA